MYYIYTGVYNISISDIDECEELSDACPENGDCWNLKGSFTCRCPRGFIAHFDEDDGKYECEGKDQ